MLPFLHSDKSYHLKRNLGNTVTKESKRIRARPLGKAFKLRASILVKRYGIQISLILLAALWLLLVATNWSDADEDVDYSSSNSGNSATTDQGTANKDEFNFKWLDPDKKVYVLQNRKYTKADHLMLSALVGPGFSNPYRSTYSLDARATYYFTENWGFEVFYSKTFNSANSTYNSLVSTQTNLIPVVRQIDQSYGLTLQWVPWYAKINVFNEILHFDWYFDGGAGTVQTSINTSGQKAGVWTTNNQFAGFLGTGHLYHVTQNFLVRLDFNCTLYSSQTSTSSSATSLYPNYNFEIGVGYRL
jgi:outer membrane beta-barrel protein